MTESNTTRPAHTRDSVPHLVSEIRKSALRIRHSILKLSYGASTPHIGSSLSCVDILAACYSLFGEDYRSDDGLLILSKGHAAPALYSTLREFHFLEAETLEDFCQVGSFLEEHPNHFVPGVPHPSGSLGHGLGFAAGFVLSGRVLGRKRRATVVLSDGECNEGTVWEAALFAGGKGLSGLVAIVDRNGLQATGSTIETYGGVDLSKSFASFGWRTTVVDGHDPAQLVAALDEASAPGDQPVCIIADTVKGKGVSFMEGDNNWHYRKLDSESMSRAEVELSEVQE